MIPEAEPPDGEGAAGPSDIAAGLWRTLWPWILAFVLVVGFVVFLLMGSNDPDDPEVRTLGGLTTALRKVGEECLDLLVADTDEERSAGLRGIESELGRVDGMLFAGEPGQVVAYNMIGMTRSLDVGYYSESGERLGADTMTPCTVEDDACPRYYPPRGFVDGIEVPAGTLPPGDLGGSCSK